MKEKKKDQDVLLLWWVCMRICFIVKVWPRDRRLIILFLCPCDCRAEETERQRKARHDHARETGPVKICLYTHSNTLSGNMDIGFRVSGLGILLPSPLLVYIVWLRDDVLPSLLYFTFFSIKYVCISESRSIRSYMCVLILLCMDCYGKY